MVQHATHVIEDIEVTAEQVSHVRAHLLPQHATQASCDDETVIRFIRATGGDLKLSAKRLNTTCTWRASNQPESVVCRACARNPRSHYMHVVGHDRLGRPIIYSCLALASNKVYEDNRDHMIQTFEMAVKCMPKGVSQWIWLCDFHGFGMADALNVKIAKAFLDISAQHYPERLGLFIVADAPPLFGMLWKAIQAFVDPKTHKKIRFLPYDVSAAHSRLAEELSADFDEETSSWLLREMAENRDKIQVKAKTYDIPSIHKAASLGHLCSAEPSAASETSTPSETREGSALPHSVSEHDLRGTGQLLGLYAKAPQVLEPQAMARA